MNDDLIELKLKKNGKKVFVNPSKISCIFQMDGEDGCVIVYDFGSCVEVVEDADTVAKMVEGEQNG